MMEKEGEGGKGGEKTFTCNTYKKDKPPFSSSHLHTCFKVNLESLSLARLFGIKSVNFYCELK